MTCPHCNRPRRHDGPASTIGSIPPDVILASRIASACASASRAPSTSPRASSRGGGYRERALSLDDLSERGDAREFDEGVAVDDSEGAHQSTSLVPSTARPKMNLLLGEDTAARSRFARWRHSRNPTRSVAE